MKKKLEDNKEQNEKYRIIMIIAVTMFVSIVATTAVIFWGFLKGKQVGNYIWIGADQTSDLSLQIENVKKMLEKYYLGEIDYEELEESAIKGYVDGLGDPYTEYIPKAKVTDYIDTTMGTYVGIGIYMTADEEKDIVRVVSVIEDSPAQKVGMKANDLIKKVDDAEIKAADIDTIPAKIKGKEDSSVKIQVIRGEETLDFVLKREKIVVNKIETKIIPNDIGYIKITSFDEKTGDEFKTKYEELKSQNITSLIVDLRNNGGGIVSESLKIADYFTDKDSVLLYEVDKNGKELIKKSENNPIVDIPVVILTNSNTASASEILAGALKDLGKAKIVGEKTYGKGIIQQILTMKDGSGLKITTEEYQTPNRSKIHKVGIEPDEVIVLKKTAKELANLKEEEDTQLQKAIEILKK
ncbi:MAG: S41 family peptidase [Clostridia bacterium]|nr:S41 family peptidase [Clostridia bacterium]